MTPDQLNAFSKTVPPDFNLPQSPTPGLVPVAPNIDQQLNALADIHLPDQISWWPPAPGWWIVLLLSLFIGYFTIRYINKKRVQHKYQKVAYNELETLTRFWHKQQNLIATASRLSPLMRRIAIADGAIHFTSTDDSIYNRQRQQIASLSDDKWLLYLEQQPGLSGMSNDCKELLIDLPYQDPMIKFDTQEQLQLAKKMDLLLLRISQWIKKGFKHV